MSFSPSKNLKKNKIVIFPPYSQFPKPPPRPCFLQAGLSFADQSEAELFSSMVAGNHITSQSSEMVRNKGSGFSYR